MKYSVEYAVCCHRGKVRSNNQDNFWCARAFLNCKNDGLRRVKAGRVDAYDTPAFAVFDGMGGEQRGEVAAYLAASSFDAVYGVEPKEDIKAFLLDACIKMNRAICSYAKDEGVANMGSTAAMVVFGKEEIYICNVGDSRIYQYSAKKLTQISHDHCEESMAPSKRKPALTQNLGIPESEFLIEPYIAMGYYGAGDRYLLCSDGLTDMVTPDEIAQMLASEKSAAKAVQALLDAALERGGIDNTTIIVCDVRKRKLLLKERRRKGEGKGHHEH